jgi:hypothetical protein
MRAKLEVKADTAPILVAIHQKLQLNFMVELKMAVVLDMNLFLLGGSLSQVPWSTIRIVSECYSCLE